MSDTQGAHEVFKKSFSPPVFGVTHARFTNFWLFSPTKWIVGQQDWDPPPGTAGHGPKAHYSREGFVFQVTFSFSLLHSAISNSTTITPDSRLSSTPTPDPLKGRSTINTDLSIFCVICTQHRLHFLKVTKPPSLGSSSNYFFYSILCCSPVNEDVSRVSAPTSLGQSKWIK